jgi:hypothetical protein
VKTTRNRPLSLEFDAPAGRQAWALDLGEVHESAEVRLNGETLATLFCKPFCVRIPADKFREHNTLEIDVANLMANRISDLDRRGVAWQKFYNVNMAARRRENAGPRSVFTAAKWAPLPSGLLGPVRNGGGIPEGGTYPNAVKFTTGRRAAKSVSIDMPGNYCVAATQA